MAVDNYLGRLPGWLFASPCVVCRGSSAAGLCDGCRQSLPWLGAACARCAMPLPGAPADTICGDCQKAPPAFDHTVAAFEYAPPIDRMLHGLKYAGHLSNARLLAQLLRERLALRDAARPSRLIPMPLHRARLRSRGFNQALEIARPLARQLRIPLDYACVSRIRDTPPQTSLDRSARRRNVRKAFHVEGDVRDHSIVVIDDVMTTGATMHELARALKCAGAARVEAWVLARAGH